MLCFPLERRGFLMEVKHNALVFLHTPFWTVMETFFGQCEFGPRDYKWKNILN